jgi:hypothetical protein
MGSQPGRTMHAASQAGVFQAGWLRIGNRGGRRSSPAKKELNRESLHPAIKTQAGGVDLKT